MFPRRIVCVLTCAVLFSFVLQVSMLSASVSSKKSVFAVVDASSGVPLSGALVTAEGSGGFGYASTNSNGQFTITNGLTSGNYKVVVSQQGYLNAENDSVSVVGGSETSGVTFYLSLSGGIFGRVTDSSSHVGLPSRPVLAYLSDGSGTYFGTAMTDQNGNYSILTNLGTGAYNVSIFLPQGYVGETLGPISVTSGIKATGIDFSLDRSGIISGRITTPGGQGLANLTVIAYGGSITSLGSSQTNATGYYRIVSGLETGSYTVMVMSGINTNSTALPPLDSLYPGGVPVTAGSETPNVDLELNVVAAPSGIIMGAVMDANNKPLAGADVTASGDISFSSGSATADQNGNYVISTGLATDTYNVTASAHGYQTQSFTSQSVTVNQITTVNFHLQAIQSGRISGTANGDPNPITPEFQYPLLMMLIATLAAVAIVRSFSGKTKQARDFQKKKI